jgi:hypothetical protein
MKNKTYYNQEEREDTEEEELRAGRLRILKVRRQFEALTGRTHDMLPLEKKNGAENRIDPKRQAEFAKIDEE